MSSLQMSDEAFFNNPLIYLRRVDSCLEATISDDGYYGFNKNVYGINIVDQSFNPKYILALLNSKFIDFYYKNKFSTKKADAFPEIQTYLYEQIPIPSISLDRQQPFVDTVNEILNICSNNPNSNIQKFLNHIDLMVYKLYDLNHDEILLVDPNLNISSEEYENLLI